MYGGLHFEKAKWNDFLVTTWKQLHGLLLIQTGMKSSEVADSFLKASHLTRTRVSVLAHQVSLLALRAITTRYSSE